MTNGKYVLISFISTKLVLSRFHIQMLNGVPRHNTDPSGAWGHREGFQQKHGPRNMTGR
jgi:hypothetical protein